MCIFFYGLLLKGLDLGIADRCLFKMKGFPFYCVSAMPFLLNKHHFFSSLSHDLDGIDQPIELIGNGVEYIDEWRH